jgi:hypothetical protein
VTDPSMAPSRSKVTRSCPGVLGPLSLPGNARASPSPGRAAGTRTSCRKPSIRYREPTMSSSGFVVAPRRDGVCGPITLIPGNAAMDRGRYAALTRAAVLLTDH